MLHLKQLSYFLIPLTPYLLYNTLLDLPLQLIQRLTNRSFWLLPCFLEAKLRLSQCLKKGLHFPIPFSISFHNQCQHFLSVHIGPRSPPSGTKTTWVKAISTNLLHRCKCHLNPKKIPIVKKMMLNTVRVSTAIDVAVMWTNVKARALCVERTANDLMHPAKYVGIHVKGVGNQK